MCRWYLSFLLIGAVSLGGCAKKDDEATKAELEKLKGTWVFASVTENGKPIKPVEGLEITFDGHVMTTNNGPKPTKHKVILDIYANPPQLDTVVSEGPTKGQTELGIYEIADDQLKMCVGLTEEPATPKDQEKSAEAKPLVGHSATAFDDKQGTLIILKRKPK